MRYITTRSPSVVVAMPDIALGRVVIHL